MSSLSSMTIDSLEDLRTVTQKLFDQQKLSAKQIINVQTQELPASIISYQYYGDSSQGERISLLNKEINVSNLKGNIDILTA